MPSRALDALRNRAFAKTTPASPLWPRLAVDQRVQWSVTRIGVSLTVPSPAGLEERLAVRPAGGWLDERGGIDKAARETAGLIANSRGT